MSHDAPSSGLSPISIRQAKVTDGDKVRYRVYRTATDFVAVIAENALMAMKVADIKEPYRIVRDLPTHDQAIPADRLIREEAGLEQKVTLSITPKLTETKRPTVDLIQKTDTPQSMFKAMQVKDIQQLAKKRKHETAAPIPPVAEPVSAMPAAQHTVPSPVAAEPPVQAAPPAPEPLPEPPADTPLSPDEVNKLLGS